MASTIAIITYHVWNAVYFDTEMGLVFSIKFDVEHCQESPLHGNEQ